MSPPRSIAQGSISTYRLSRVGSLDSGPRSVALSHRGARLPVPRRVDLSTIIEVLPFTRDPLRHPTRVAGHLQPRPSDRATAKRMRLSPESVRDVRLRK